MPAPTTTFPKPHALDEVIARLRACSVGVGDSRPAVLQAGTLPSIPPRASPPGEGVAWSSPPASFVCSIPDALGGTGVQPDDDSRVLGLQLRPGSNIVDVYVRSSGKDRRRRHAKAHPQCPRRGLRGPGGRMSISRRLGIGYACIATVLHHPGDLPAIMNSWRNRRSTPSKGLTQSCIRDTGRNVHRLLPRPRARASRRRMALGAPRAGPLKTLAGSRARWIPSPRKPCPQPAGDEVDRLAAAFNARRRVSTKASGTSTSSPSIPPMNSRLR